jgi:tetratricopeptide (TPR) repeat protein
MNRNERRRAAATARPQPADGLRRGFALHQAGNLLAAERAYRDVLDQAPDEPEALRLLGEVLLDRGRFEEAIALQQRFAARFPAHFAAQYSLANAYRLAGRLTEAIAAYREAVRLNPGFAGAHHGLGAALLRAGREADAAPCFRAAVRAKPDWAAAWLDLGTTCAAVGELDEAATALRRALALQPALSEARRHLAALQDDPPAAAAARAADAQVPAAERIDLLFALGRAADRAGTFADAFRHFEAANRLLRMTLAQAGHAYDRAKMARDVEKLIAAFPRAAFAAPHPGADLSEAPVFILGMPRAGSTLFEQIAASHSQVFGAGERKGIGEIAARIGWRPSPAWSPDAIRAAAAGYLDGAPAGGAARIIDKMPDNIFQLGLIATMFPHARVIFCARDPLDTCLSCYFQRFAEPYVFDTDLDDCADRYRAVALLAAHWQSVLPLRMMTLSYDALVSDLEGQARRLIAFLGLDWEPGCLDFHTTRRTVRTASWAQVRQPLYQTASGRWRNYRQFLGGLIAEFDSKIAK